MHTVYIALCTSLCARSSVHVGLLQVLVDVPRRSLSLLLVLSRVL